MNKRFALFAVAVLSVGLMTSAFAHKAEVVGEYRIEVGWKNEPPVVGKKNAVEITITKASAEDKKMAESDDNDHESDHADSSKMTTKAMTTKTAYSEQKDPSKITLAVTKSSTKMGTHTHKTKKTTGISGLAKALEADITLNGKKTFLKLTEDKKNKGTYYGEFTPDSEGFPTVHIVGKINGTPVEVSFHLEKIVAKK